MLEILFVIWVSKIFGEKATEKGYSRGLFRGLAISAWFTGEMTAAFASFFILGQVNILSYVIALAGAAVGIGIVALVLIGLPEKDMSQAAFIGDRIWACPECGFKNIGYRHRCFKCRAEKPAAPAEAAMVRSWTCPGCNAANLAADDYCFRCKHIKPTATV
jgi:hypothetical protein